mmetsp:Transcript_31714/g.76797  ORF Transcript_31714/g.76797 Transcript_31714/m.76797 type:complete len:218 (-) Transcript_31714:463-1116(-)
MSTYLEKLGSLFRRLVHISSLRTLRLRSTSFSFVSAPSRSPSCIPLRRRRRRRRRTVPAVAVIVVVVPVVPATFPAICGLARFGTPSSSSTLRLAGLSRSSSSASPPIVSSGGHTHLATLCLHSIRCHPSSTMVGGDGRLVRSGMTAMPLVMRMRRRRRRRRRMPRRSLVFVLAALAIGLGGLAPQFAPGTAMLRTSAAPRCAAPRVGIVLAIVRQS